MHAAVTGCERRATVVIIGGGAHSLAVLSALHERSQSFQEVGSETVFERLAAQCHLECIGSVCIIDPGKGFLEEWKKRFDVLGIQHLRSPAFAHPKAFEPQALMSFALRRGRESELVNAPTVARLLASGDKDSQQPLMHARPSHALFCDFCSHLAANLPHEWISGTAIHVHKTDCGGQYNVRYVQNNAEQTVGTVAADAVILATGPNGKWNVPESFSSLLGSARVQHVEHIFASGELYDIPEAASIEVAIAPKTPSKVLVIGGGLTAVQAALSLVHMGHRVALRSRRPLQTREYDLSSEWIDHRHTNRKRFEYLNASLQEREEILRESRRGGTVPAAYLGRLQQLVADGASLELQVDAEIDRSMVCLENDKVKVNGKMFDLVILATGTMTAPLLSPFYKQLQNAFDAPVVGHFPHVDLSLRWVKDENIFVVGANAALELGPGALNLMGAMRGAKIVAKELQDLMWASFRPKGFLVSSNIFELLNDEDDD